MNLRVAKQLLATHYALMLEYRAEIFLWVFAGIMPFILMGLWSQAATATGGFPTSTGRPLSATQLQQYFVAVFIIRQLTIVWVIWDFEYNVVQGRLSALLLKPIDPAWGFVTAHLSEQATRLPFWVAIIAVFFACYPQALRTWPVNPVGLALFLPTMALVFTLRFLIQYTLAMLCFWLERASAIETLSYLPYIFLSGFMAPLAVFPPLVARLARLTPYPYLIDFPARLLTGAPIAAAEMLQSFLLILAWIGVLFVLNRFLWRRGLRNYSSMGA